MFVLVVVPVTVMTVEMVVVMAVVRVVVIVVSTRTHRMHHSTAFRMSTSEVRLTNTVLISPHHTFYTTLRQQTISCGQLPLKCRTSRGLDCPCGQQHRKESSPTWSWQEAT